MDCVKEKEVSVVKISTNNQIANILTKAIANPQFAKGGVKVKVKVSVETYYTEKSWRRSNSLLVVFSHFHQL
jgi:hypothetical protein